MVTETLCGVEPSFLHLAVAGKEPGDVGGGSRMGLAICADHSTFHTTYLHPVTDVV